jgi:hypothetical protein
MILTTPIAYITSLPDHVFLQDTAHDLPLVLPKYHPICTILYLNKVFRDQMNWYWLPRWTAHGWSEWILFSYGPSGQLAGHTTDSEVSYDPTNGTVSSGGIYRGGPGGNNAL